MNRLSVTGDAEQVVDVIARAARQMMDADEAYLLLREGRYLILRAADGLPEELLGRQLFRMGEGIEGWVADHGDPVALGDARLERRFRDISRTDPPHSCPRGGPDATAGRRGGRAGSRQGSRPSLPEGAG